MIMGQRKMVINFSMIMNETNFYAAVDNEEKKYINYFRGYNLIGMDFVLVHFLFW